MSRTRQPGEDYTTGEVGRIFRVDPRTVSRWVASGRITAKRTPGGRFRIPESEVDRLLERKVNADDR